MDTGLSSQIEMLSMLTPMEGNAETLSLNSDLIPENRISANRSAVDGELIGAKRGKGEGAVRLEVV